ncbi:MAG: hypothetical protein AAF944_13510 [Bacteroidota bacterium]
MPPRLALLLYSIISALFLTRCDHQVRYRKIPFKVQRYFRSLPDWQYPQKVEIDRVRRRIYWLNKQGEICLSGMDARGATLVNKGMGAQLGITFISDFTINDQNATLYFTDLMDVSTGQSALKMSDATCSHIETLATFTDKIAYVVHWNNESQQLYYATRQKGGKLYQVHQLGKPELLATSHQKINDISRYIELPDEETSQAPLVAEHLSENNLRDPYWPH